GRDFSTPERRAGLERSLQEIASRIGDSKIAGYYRREFEQRVFAMFQPPRRKPSGEGRKPSSTFSRDRGFSKDRGRFATAEPSVSPAVRQSLLAKSGRAGAIRLKEREVAQLLLEAPEIAQLHGELLAALSFTEPLLDRLREELLNLAASGSRL